QGSSPTRTITVNDLSMYAIQSNMDPNPATGLSGAGPSDIALYTKGNNASSNTWLLNVNADTFTASILTKNLYGGAMYFTYSFPVTVNEVGNTTGNITFYPNPTSNAWSVYMPVGSGISTVSIFSMEG